MTLKRGDLEAAAAAGVLQRDQVDPLLRFLNQRASRAGTAKFSGTLVLYYLGGLLAIGAASLFATLAVEALGMGALFGLSVLYAFFAIGVAIWFEKKELGVPAGIFATLAIALVPLAVFALQHLLGFWADGRHAQHYRDYHRWIDWRWLIMELSTLAVGAVMLWRFRYTFLVMPIAFTLWYMGMDVVPALIMQADGGSDVFYSAASWELRKKISLAFGLIMVLFAFFVDLRSRHSKDYAFWLYLFGLLTFWGALTSMGSGQLAGKLFYLAINFLMICIAAILGRRVFAVFGGIGVVLVLGNLSWGMFKNSFAFVAVLTLLGFALIGAGVWWSKHEAEIASKVRALLPRDLRELLEARTG
jgi:MFS family permease